MERLRGIVLGLALVVALLGQATPAAADDLIQSVFDALTAPSSESSSPGWE